MCEEEACVVDPLDTKALWEHVKTQYPELKSLPYSKARVPVESCARKRKKVTSSGTRATQNPGAVKTDGNVERSVGDGDSKEGLMGASTKVKKIEVDTRYIFSLCTLIL